MIIYIAFELCRMAGVVQGLSITVDPIAIQINDYFINGYNSWPLDGEKTPALVKLISLNSLIIMCAEI